MEADAVIPSQALCWVPGTQVREERSTYEQEGSRPCWRKAQRQLTWTSRSSQTLDWQLGTCMGPTYSSQCGWQPYGLICWEASGSRTRIYPRHMNWLIGAHFLWWDTLLSLDTGGSGLVLSKLVCQTLPPWETLHPLRSEYGLRWQKKERVEELGWW